MRGYFVSRMFACENITLLFGCYMGVYLCCDYTPIDYDKICWAAEVVSLIRKVNNGFKAIQSRLQSFSIGIELICRNS